MSKVLTAREAAEMLGLNVFTLYSYVRRRQIPAIRIGDRLIRFSESDLQVWLEKQKQAVRV